MCSLVLHGYNHQKGSRLQVPQFSEFWTRTRASRRTGRQPCHVAPLPPHPIVAIPDRTGRPSSIAPLASPPLHTHACIHPWAIPQSDRPAHGGMTQPQGRAHRREGKHLPATKTEATPVLGRVQHHVGRKFPRRLWSWDGPFLLSHEAGHRQREAKARPLGQRSQGRTAAGPSCDPTAEPKRLYETHLTRHLPTAAWGREERATASGITDSSVRGFAPHRSQAPEGD